MCKDADRGAEGGPSKTGADDGDLAASDEVMERPTIGQLFGECCISAYGAMAVD